MPIQSSSTLTQRRGREEHDNTPPKATISSIDQMMKQKPADDGSVLKVLIWGIAILATGIGLALLVRNATKENANDTNTDTNKTAQETEDDTADDTTDDNGTDEETTDDTSTPDSNTNTDEGTDDTTTDDNATDDTDNTPTTNNNLTNDYSRNDQAIGEGLTTNTVTIGGYSYTTTATNFVYTIKLANATKFPNVSATLDSDAKTLTVIVNNVARDNIVGNGGTGSTEFAKPRNTTSVDISNTSNKTTFVYKLTRVTDYKIYADTTTDGIKTIKVDIKNN